MSGTEVGPFEDVQGRLDAALLRGPAAADMDPEMAELRRALFKRR